MPSVLDILNGVQGGIEGGIKGYTTAQDLADRKMARQATLDAIKARMDAQTAAEQDRQDNLARETARDKQAASDRAAAEADKQTNTRRAYISSLPDSPYKRQLLAKEGASMGLDVPDDAFSQANLELPPYLKTAPVEVQNAWLANGGKGTFTPDMFVSPEERARREALKKQSDDAEALNLFRQEEGIRQSIANQNLNRDDPSLPNGARTYIGGLASKYGGDYASADREFVSSLPGLLTAHPHMDVTKARAQFEASFNPGAIPPKQTDSGNAIRAVTTQNTAPAAPPSGGRGAGPGTAPPAAAAPPRAAAPGNPNVAQLTQQAMALAAQGKAETDPAKKAALAQQAQALRAQLVAAGGGGPQ